MKVITFESDVFKQLEKKIDSIAGFVTSVGATPNNKDPDWSDIRLESEEICDILNISPERCNDSAKMVRYSTTLKKGSCIKSR